MAKKSYTEGNIKIILVKRLEKNTMPDGELVYSSICLVVYVCTSISPSRPVESLNTFKRRNDHVSDRQFKFLERNEVKQLDTFKDPESRHIEGRYTEPVQKTH